MNKIVEKVPKLARAPLAGVVLVVALILLTQDREQEEGATYQSPTPATISAPQPMPTEEPNTIQAVPSSEAVDTNMPPVEPLIPSDDFGLLLATEDMFLWLSEEPFITIKQELEKTLQEELPESTLLTFRAISEPQWLTGGRPGEDDPEEMIVVRTAVAFEFDAMVDSPEGIDYLTGVYTWAGINLDQPGNQEFRLWLDIDGTLEDFGNEDLLKLRIYFDGPKGEQETAEPAPSREQQPPALPEGPANDPNSTR